MSVVGHGNGELAGGDYDGDHNQLSKNKPLKEFLDFTQPDLDQIPHGRFAVLVRKDIEDANIRVQQRGNHISTEFLGHSALERACELVVYASRFTTKDVRGLTANAASRAAEQLFLTVSSGGTGEPLAALLLAVLAQIAMDVPKKEMRESVVFI